MRLRSETTSHSQPCLPATHWRWWTACQAMPHPPPSGGEGKGMTASLHPFAKRAVRGVSSGL